MAEPRDRKVLIAGRCRSAWCMNPPIPNKGYCHKCRSRKYKFNNTLGYSFNLLRSGARRRGIVFTITIEDYTDLWMAHPDRWEQKRKNILRANCPQGRTGRNTWEVDRIDPRLGYEKGNLQLLPKCSNVAKSNRERWKFLGATGRVKETETNDGYVCPY